MEPLKEGRYKKIRILIVFLLMNLCFYGIFSVEHFAADTYVSENVGWADTAALYFSNGRWLMTLICLFSGFFISVLRWRRPFPGLCPLFFCLWQSL